MGELTFFKIVFFVVYFVVLGSVSLAAYLLQAFGLNKMGKSLNVNNPWLAFIPYANVFAFGRIAEKYVKVDGKNSAKFSKILLTLYIIMSVLAFAVSALAVAVIVMAISNEFGNYIDTMALGGIIFAFFITAIITFAVSIGYLIAYYIALWRIFAIFDYHNATLYLILSILVSILCPIFIFALRKKEPKIFPYQRMNYVQVPTEQPVEEVNNTQE